MARADDVAGGAAVPADVPTAQHVDAASQSHFGDLMGLTETDSALPDGFTPLERIVLTANGNLQRIISSYYNTKVTVNIKKCDRRPGTTLFDREVELSCFGLVFCVARSEVHITDDSLLDLIESKKVGIGQLFRHLSILPYFTLLDAGKSAETFFRRYELRARGIRCQIHETFPLNLFSLPTPS